MAYDTLHESALFVHYYAAAEKEESLAYFDRQLSKIDVEDITDDDRHFMREMMLIMYANPLKNKLRSILGGFE